MNRKGFTLIEILVVIGIIAVLAAIVLIAINPARQFAQARNTQRTSNVEAVLNAFGQYIADNKGDLPAGLDSSSDDDVIGWCDDLVPTYLPAMPTDPNDPDNDGADVDCTADSTSYEVTYTGDERIQVCAPETEGIGDMVDEEICVTR